MTEFPSLKIDDAWILENRGEKNTFDPRKPYAFHIEKERGKDGNIHDVITIFLSNKECVFHCLMCDLWKNTTEKRVAQGDIPFQIEFALSQLPPANQIKLYNSGNFFDKNSIPPEDFCAIASLLKDFKTVVVECHPKLINENVIRFQDMLVPELQVAIGLETIHPGIIGLLNKQMTSEDFRSAVHFLTEHGISSRAFILLRPPFLNEEEGVEWAKKSLDFAVDCGVECCIIIPTRPGNGAMDILQTLGYFHRPSIQSLENVLEYGVESFNKCRIFADVWDLDQFSNCTSCSEDRYRRLHNMNLHQKIFSPITCKCNIEKN